IPKNEPKFSPTGRIGNGKRPSVQELDQRLSDGQIGVLPRSTSPDRLRVSIHDAGEVLGDLRPVVDPDEAGGLEVVGGGVEDALAFKAEEVFGQVVDEVVGA